MLDNYWISTQKLALIKGVSARAGRVQFFAPQYNAQRGKTIKFSFHLALFIKLQVKYSPFYIKTGEIFFSYNYCPVLGVHFKKPQPTSYVYIKYFSI